MIKEDEDGMIDEIPAEDLAKMTVQDAYRCVNQRSFTVCGLLFENDGEGTFHHKGIAVYHDQQDSTAWYARRGAMQIGPDWTPQWAALGLLQAVKMANADLFGGDQ